MTMRATYCHCVARPRAINLFGGSTASGGLHCLFGSQHLAASIPQHRLEMFCEGKKRIEVVDRATAILTPYPPFGLTIDQRLVLAWFDAGADFRASDLYAHACKIDNLSDVASSVSQNLKRNVGIVIHGSGLSGRVPRVDVLHGKSANCLPL